MRCSLTAGRGRLLIGGLVIAAAGGGGGTPRGGVLLLACAPLADAPRMNPCHKNSALGLQHQGRRRPIRCVRARVCLTKWRGGRRPAAAATTRRCCLPPLDTHPLARSTHPPAHTGAQQPYASLKFGRFQVRTKADAGGGRNPRWHETFFFNTQAEAEFDVSVRVTLCVCCVSVVVLACAFVCV